MSDCFHEDVPTEFLDKIFAVMALCPQHTFQILTKRPARMKEYLEGEVEWRVQKVIEWFVKEFDNLLFLDFELPLDNVWLGVSVEDQATTDERIPILLQTESAIRFISAEPLLGAVDLSAYLGDEKGLDWVIVGGESGSHARPMNPDWVRAIQRQCAEIKTAFFFKQWGEYAPIQTLEGEVMRRIGKKAAGDYLYGKQYLEYPKLK